MALLKRGRPGPVTVAKAYRLLRTICETAVSDEMIARNPCNLKGAAVEHSPERPVLTVAEVEALAGCHRGPLWRRSPRRMVRTAPGRGPSAHPSRHRPRGGTAVDRQVSGRAQERRAHRARPRRGPASEGFIFRRMWCRRCRPTSSASVGQIRRTSCSLGHKVSRCGGDLCTRLGGERGRKLGWVTYDSMTCATRERPWRQRLGQAPRSS